jgi:hypothetical protein
MVTIHTQKIIHFCIIMLFMILAGILLATKLNYIPFSGDEYDDVSRGFFLDLYIQRRFQDKRWATFDSYDQQQLPNYFFRGVLMLFHVSPPNVLPLYPSWGKYSWCKLPIYTATNCLTSMDNWMWTEQFLNRIKVVKFNEDIYKELPFQMQKKLEPILAARKGEFVVAFGVVFVYLFLIRNFFGTNTAIVAAILLVFNKTFQNSLLRVDGDGLCLLFLLISIYLAIYFFRIKERNFGFKKVTIAAFIGLAIGLSASAKLNGFIGFGYFILMQFTSRSFSIKYTFIYMLLIVSIALLVFSLINPFVWNNPIGNLYLVFVHRQIVTEYFQILYKSDALPTVLLRIIALLRLSVTSTFSQHMPMPFGNIVDLLSFLIGIIVVVKRCVYYPILHVTSKFIVVWYILTFFTMSLYMGLNWDRYYVPLILPTIAIQSVGLICICYVFLYHVQRKYNIFKIFG